MYIYIHKLLISDDPHGLGLIVMFTPPSLCGSLTPPWLSAGERAERPACQLWWQHQPGGQGAVELPLHYPYPHPHRHRHHALLLHHLSLRLHPGQAPALRSPHRL